MRPTQRPTLDLTLQGSSPETNRTLPDINPAIAWRSWEEGRDEAARLKMPMLVLAEPAWANSSQRIALRLGEDASLANLVESKVIPVLVDPDNRPDLAAHWRWVAMALTGTAGPPLLVFLTHEADPFLAYCTMNLEGDDTYPSLSSLVESVSEAYTDNPDSLIGEATSISDAGSMPEDSPQRGWDLLRQMVDVEFGGLDELPRHPRPMLLWNALEAHVRGELPDDLAHWLRKTLDAMIRGGIHDQLDRGFHRCARDARWVVPHFEKPVPLNAQLAAVYARAAHVFEDETYRDIAKGIASFCLAAVNDDVDVIESDTTYYTWTSREVRTQLEPELLQVISLHFNIQPIDNRQALHRVIEMDEMDRYSHEDVDVLRARLVRGQSQMRSIRQRRPAPRTFASSALASRAVTLRWLLIAAEWLDTIDSAAVIPSLDTLIEGRVDTDRGYSRTDTPGDAWLEDQAALLAVFVEAYRASDNTRWLDRARELGGILVQEWWTGQGWRDRPGDDATSRDIVDDLLPSALGMLAESLRQLGSLAGDQSLAHIATTTATRHRQLAAQCGHWSEAVPITT